MEQKVQQIGNGMHRKRNECKMDQMENGTRRKELNRKGGGDLRNTKKLINIFKIYSYFFIFHKTVESFLSQYLTFSINTFRWSNFNIKCMKVG